jgi:hypothetical protein
MENFMEGHFSAYLKCIDNKCRCIKDRAIGVCASPVTKEFKLFMVPDTYNCFINVLSLMSAS